ncbi:steroid 17-alpha-hydroxylase/17,20 lyase-like isoform X2 [Apostichopus japonicus]
MEVEKAVTPTLLVMTVSLMAGLWYWLQKKPHPKFPPGPKGWPIIGNMLDFVSIGPHHLFMSLAEKYGNVFSMKIGAHWNVILNGSETIKEALIKYPVEFAGRPHTFSSDIFTEGGKDIAFSQYTPTWKLHRKLAHTAFRTLATGNNEKFENLVFGVTEKVGKMLTDKGSEQFDPKNIISLAVYNFIAQMVFGKQYELDDPDLIEWRSLSQESIEVFGNGLMADFFPIMQYFPSSGVRGLHDLMARFLKLLNDEIARHKETYNPDEEPKDVVEMLFKARQDMIDSGEEGIDKISETHLKMTVFDIFSAGTDTSIFTLQWAVACLVDFPEVQEKVQKEIDDVIGSGRLPKMDDRGTLPYTESTLYEVFRYSSITPLTLPHATTKDVNFGGYFIPKGTWILPNVYSMHFDKKLWGDPENFRPEHFLNETGTMRQHPEGFLPFSTGRRVCLGESVAKAELFLIFTWLFQNFSFKKPAGKEKEVYSFVDKTALTPVLKGYEVIVTKRS